MRETTPNWQDFREEQCSGFSNSSQNSLKTENQGWGDCNEGVEGTEGETPKVELK